jgi:quinol monooxygenase YgiN
MSSRDKINIAIDKRGFCLGSASLLLAGGSASAQAPATSAPASAPTTPQSVSPQYVVSYFEVAPASVPAVSRLVRAYLAAVREDKTVSLGAFRGAFLPYHFAIVGHWSDTVAFAAHGDGAAAKAFRGALATHLIAPYDERRHYALEVGKTAPARSGLITITHVDLIQAHLQAGVEAVKAIATQSRVIPGCLRFDVLTQNNRVNHMTVVQAWRDVGAHRRYIVSALSKNFRNSLLARSGSLYDERYYIDV